MYTLLIFLILPWFMSQGRAQTLIQTYTAHTSKIVGMAVDSDGEFLVSAATDGSVKIWNSSSRSLLKSISMANPINAIAVSLNFIYVSDNISIKKLDLNTGITLMTFSTAITPGTLYAYDQYIFAGMSDNSIRQFDVTNGTLLKTFTGHTNIISELAISDGFLYSASLDNSIRKWNITTQASAGIYGALGNPLNSLIVDYQPIIYGGSTTGIIRRWDSSGTTVTFKDISTSTSSVRIIAHTLNNFYTYTSDGTIRQWDAVTAVEKIRSAVISTSELTSAVLYDNILYTGFLDGVIRVFELPVYVSLLHLINYTD